MATSYLRRMSYGVGLQSTPITSNATLSFATSGVIVVDAADQLARGVDSDTRGYANDVDASAGSVTVTITPPGDGAANHRSKIVLKRIDSNDSNEVIISAPLNFSQIDPEEEDAASMQLKPGEVVVLQRIKGSTQVHVSIGTTWVKES